MHDRYPSCSRPDRYPSCSHMHMHVGYGDRPFSTQSAATQSTERVQVMAFPLVLLAAASSYQPLHHPALCAGVSRCVNAPLLVGEPEQAANPAVVLTLLTYQYMPCAGDVRLRFACRTSGANRCSAL